MNERQKKLLTSIAILLFILLMGGIFWYVGKPLLEFVSEPARFRAWVGSHGLWGRLLFMGVMILQVFVAIIPGEPLEIVAGYAFGALEGTLLCITGQTIGSVLVFSFVRKFGVKALEIFFSKEKIDSVQFLQNSKKLDALVFLVFLIPGTPKDILCYGVGLTKMPLGTWIAISSVARIPSIVTSTIGGDMLGLGAHEFAVLAFGIALAIAAIGAIFYQKIQKKHAQEEESIKSKTTRAKTAKQKKG